MQQLRRLFQYVLESKFVPLLDAQTYGVSTCISTDRESLSNSYHRGTLNAETILISVCINYLASYIIC